MDLWLGCNHVMMSCPACEGGPKKSGQGKEGPAVRNAECAEDRCKYRVVPRSLDSWLAGKNCGQAGPRVRNNYLQRLAASLR